MLLLRHVALFILVAAISRFLPASDQTIFVFGDDINQKFVRYVAELTGKPNPAICYLPTASGDNPDNITFWERICRNLSLEPHILKVWVSADPKNPSFADQILGMDALVVGGGNTLNMMGIWKAQGIDQILRQAAEKGIILAGGSAGSLCWFETGISDSRPTQLSLVEGLGLLPFSNCPHYDQAPRRDLFHQMIGQGTLKPGFACAPLSGILFRNGQVVEAVSLNDVNHSYRVSRLNGRIQAQPLPDRILIDPRALDKGSYTRLDVRRTLREFPETASQATPVKAFVTIKQLFLAGKQSRYKALCTAALQERLKENLPDKAPSEAERKQHLDTRVEAVLIYHDRVAAVVNLMYEGFYGLWYFYRENGTWLSNGEGYGGESVLHSEIIFRENAREMEARWLNPPPATTGQ